MMSNHYLDLGKNLGMLNSGSKKYRNRLRASMNEVGFIGRGETMNLAIAVACMGFLLLGQAAPQSNISEYTQPASQGTFILFLVYYMLKEIRGARNKGNSHDELVGVSRDRCEKNSSRILAMELQFRHIDEKLGEITKRLEELSKK